MHTEMYNSGTSFADIECLIMIYLVLPLIMAIKFLAV